MATSSMVLLLAVTSNIFGAVFARLGTANWITQSLLSLQMPPTLMLILILILIFLLGWPFEWPAIILVFLPIFYPVVAAMKIDLVWFGALVAVVLQTAFLSPPVAMSAYYLKQVVKDWSLDDHLCRHVPVHDPAGDLRRTIWSRSRRSPPGSRSNCRPPRASRAIPEAHEKVLERQRSAPSLEDDEWGSDRKK